MPIPLIIAGLAAAGIGALGHIGAKEMNEEAERLSRKAQRIYNEENTNLQMVRTKTETAPQNLGNPKNVVLNTSLIKFVNAYEKFKDIQFTESEGIYELSNFTIEKQDAIQLREMSNIYQSAFKTGAITAVAAGGIATVAGVAASPLAVVAAPVVLFTGISASIKADENLEKAKASYAEAEAAVEKMKTAQTLCNAITERSNMHTELLTNLNQMFSECTNILDGIARNKTNFFKRRISAKELTPEELKLLAVTRSLAGAVKSVIDVPILNSDGTVSEESENKYDNTVKSLPAFSNAYEEVKSYDYDVKVTKDNYNYKAMEQKSNKSGTSKLENWLSVIGIILGVVLAFVSVSKYPSYNICMVTYAVVSLVFFTPNTKSNVWKFFKNISCVLLAVGMSLDLLNHAETLSSINYSWLVHIGLMIISFFVAVLFLFFPSNRLFFTIARILIGLSFCAAAILLFSLLFCVFHIPLSISKIIVGILLIPLAWVAVRSPEFA